jgi:tetratricopeptide (TPR) repeat protein
MVEDTEDVDAIIGAVKEMIGRHKTSDVLHEVLGDIYIKTGKMRLALETYKDLGKDKKDDGESLYKFAGRCIDFKAYDTAIEAIDQYLATSSKLRRNDMALLLKGRALKQAGRDNLALAILQDISRTARDTRIRGEAGYLTGIIHAENNLCEQALTVWEKSLGFDHYRRRK